MCPDTSRGEHGLLETDKDFCKTGKHSSGNFQASKHAGPGIRGEVVSFCLPRKLISHNSFFSSATEFCSLYCAGYSGYQAKAHSLSKTKARTQTITWYVTVLKMEESGPGRKVWLSPCGNQSASQRRSKSMYFNIGLSRWLRQQRVCLQCRRPRFAPWVWKIPWRREWLPHSSILAWRIPWIEKPGKL